MSSTPNTTTPTSLRSDSRICRVYGHSPLAIRCWLRYFRDACAFELLTESLRRNTLAGKTGFASLDRPCSRTYYERKALTFRQRQSREAEARVERGERFGVRQAA